MLKNCKPEQFKSLFYSLWFRYRATFLAGLIAGLVAHTFNFTNKLLNADEVSALFGKGWIYASGRWGLKLFEPLFPNYSMPWLWGLLSLVFISIAACITVRIFEIKSPVFQMLLSAMMTCIPAVTGTFCYMFTAIVYFFALILAVLPVYLATGQWKHRWLVSVFLLVIMMGVYQAYILVTSSFFVVYIIKELLDNKKTAKNIFVSAVKYVLLLLVSLIVYYLVSRIINVITHAEFLEYAFTKYGILKRVRLAYTAFLGTFIKGYFGFVSNKFSLVLHLVSMLVLAYSCVLYLVKQKDIYKKLLFILCIVLLPLSINGIYLIADPGVIYAIVLYSFVAVYVLAVVVSENVETDKKLITGSVLKTALALTVIVNIVFANKIYLKQYLMYEEAHSFWTGVVTKIQLCEGYDANSKIAIIGSTDNIYRPDEIDTNVSFSPAPLNPDLINIYTKEYFIRYYLGFELNYADKDEIRTVAESEDFTQMTYYPYYGSVKMIGDTVVVKLGDY